MMTGRFLVAASLLALAACGSKGDGNSTSGSGGGLLGGSVQLQPGEWESTTTLIDMKGPGMTPAVIERMKATPRTSRDCMTEEEAKAPKPDAFAPSGNGMNCKQEDFVWGNGRIHGKSSCAVANGGGTMTMAIDGSYTPTTMDMTFKMDTNVHNIPSSTEMHMTGRRVGECPAGEAGKGG